MKKILIVDYDQNSLASLRSIFAAQGYEVVTAADGQNGWDKYNKETPDLVLMEAMLPKVHGFELCQRITSERNSKAPVFIMTGVYKDRVYRTEALRTYGASEYFEKPLKMAELLAAVEAVLGKPEPRPAEARPAVEPPFEAGPARGLRPEPGPAGPRKRDRPKSDDSIFSLPDDLNRMSRETPKSHRPVSPQHAPDAEDAKTDELLRTVLIEATSPKTVHAKPGNGNGNGNGNADIDQFLKSALADLDLDKEKIKVPKTAPLPPPPPVEEKSAPPRPDIDLSHPATKDMKNVLTPGDPGSDVSPFYTPERPKPAERAERKVAGPEPRHQAPSREQVRPEPVRQEPVKRWPATHEPAKPEPLPHESKNREASVIASAGIFKDVAGPEEKKGFPKLIVIGLGVVALAAVGFILLRPKRPAVVEPAPQQSSQALSQADKPAPPVEEAPAPKVKPAPAKAKAQPQTKPEDPGPAAADAILPTGPAAALPLPGTLLGSGSGNDGNATGTSPLGTDPAAAKAEGTASGPGTSAASPAPTAPPVKEGDLVELGAVTESPKLVKTVEPIYPQTAQRLGREGQITVNALIDEKGSVIDTGILKGIQDDMGLGRAAEIAVRKWKFQPARKNGVPVKVWKSFVIAFKADTNPANKTE